MLTHCLLRGLSVATALAAFWFSATGAARAQDILKELEQNEQGQTREHHGHEHAAPDMKKQNAAKQDEHKGHKEHKGISRKSSIENTAGTGRRRRTTRRIRA
jgi:hypothetical protein